MKLPELKNKFKNKYVIRIVAGVLMVGMLGTSFQAYTVHAEKNETSTEATEETSEADADTESTEDEEALSDLLGDGLSVSEKTIGKDETVYVITDSNGNAQETIVSDHLINNDDEATLTDASTLTDIENVKGNETYTQSGNTLTWQADGNDIYYQGTSTEETPVTQQVTYYLDGQEIAPEDLAGQSGKVTIRFDYTNNAKVGDVYVPFAAISGMILDDSFSDIEVTNGKVISDGNSNVIIGYALPGLSESLQLDDEDLNEEVNIPEYFEVTADVEDFQLDMTMTMVVNAANYVSTDGGLDLSSVDDLLDSLTDATSQLEDGSATLAEGLSTLQSKMSEFSDGVTKIQSGIQSYTDGTSSLASGIGSLKTGIDTLAGSTPALVSGVSQLKEGSDSAVSGGNTIIAGYEGDGTAENPGLVSGAKSVAEGANTLSEGATTLADGASQVSAGVDQLVTMISGMESTIDASKTAAEDEFKSKTGMDVATATATITGIKTVESNLITAIAAESSASGTIAGTWAAIGAQSPAIVALVSAQGVTVNSVDTAKQAIAILDETMLNLEEGIGQVEGAQTALDGVKSQLTSDTVTSSLAALQSGAKDVADGASSLSAGASTLSTGAATVSGGVQKVYEGTKSLVAGMTTIQGGLTTLNDSTGTLSSGVTQLQSGAQQLSDGAATLTANNDTLVSGMSTLASGTAALSDGVDQLSDGSKELADGIVQFNEEGIEKIVNAYNGDVKDLVDRVQSVIDAGEEYQTYTDIADGVNGSVKFVYKTAAVKTTDAE